MSYSVDGVFRVQTIYKEMPDELNLRLVEIINAIGQRETQSIVIGRHG